MTFYQGFAIFHLHGNRIGEQSLPVVDLDGLLITWRGERYRFLDKDRRKLSYLARLVGARGVWLEEWEIGRDVFDNEDHSHDATRKFHQRVVTMLQERRLDDLGAAIERRGSRYRLNKERLVSSTNP